MFCPHAFFLVGYFLLHVTCILKPFWYSCIFCRTEYSSIALFCSLLPSFSCYLCSSNIYAFEELSCSIGVQITCSPSLKPTNFLFIYILHHLSQRSLFPAVMILPFLLTLTSPLNLGVNTYLLLIDLVMVIGPVGFCNN